MKYLIPIKQFAALCLLFALYPLSPHAATSGHGGYLATVQAGADNPIPRRSRFTLEPPFAVDQGNRRRFSPSIARIARQYRLDPELIHAVISVESGYNPQAVSPKGAMGLMQLMPATAALYGVDDPFEPIANIRAGSRHLRHLLDKFKRINLALAAYNAGSGTVAGNRNTVPPYLETRKYVNLVLGFYMYYKRSL